MNVPDNDFTKLTQDWYQQWEKGMTSWWDQVLENPAFLSSMGDTLAQKSQVDGAYAKLVDENLTRAHLPTRTDLIRVLRVASLLEDKILGVEDRLLAMSETLQRIEREALTARIEAAETRIELKERLAALDERLAALSTPAASTEPTSKPASKPAAKRTPAKRTRKSPAKKKA